MSIKKAIIKMAENINIEDNRQQGKVKYPLIPTIITIFLAWCAGCNNCREIAEFWEYKKKELKKLVPDFPKDNISHDTVNRIMRVINFNDFHRFLTDFAKEMLESSAEFNKQLRVLSLDGQTPRAIEYEPKKGALGVPSNDRRLYDKLYYITLQDTTNNLSFGVEEVQDKENENKACVRLIELFNLQGIVVTADALNTQRSVAQAILNQDGDYCLALKNNHKKLAMTVRDAFATKIEEAQTYITDYEKEHGRIEQRTVVALPASLIPKSVLGEWKADCNTLFMSTTTSHIVKYDEDRAPEVRYFLSSLSYDTPNIAEIGYKTIRSHWGIENKLHYVLDMSFGQDHMQIKNRNFLRNIEVLDRITLNMIRILQKDLQKGASPVSVKRARDSVRYDVSIGLKAMLKYFGMGKNEIK